MLDRMRSTVWLKRASLATALFVAGAVAGDFAVRGSKSADLSQVTPRPATVVHKRTVRTVHLHPHAPGAGGSPSVPTTAAPRSVPTATPVSSGASPGAAGSSGGDDGEVEHGD